MWGELLRNGSVYEISLSILLLAGVGFLLVLPGVWICGKVVALNQPPDKRALYTAGLPYIGAAVFVWLASRDGDMIPAFAAPLVPMPGAVAIYFWLRYIYRKSWIDDSENLNEIELENNDWKIGVIVVVGTITILGVRFIIKYALQR